ncbi:hypothetical protein FHS14_002070 [Paenibacillus baekrokdamisoli]|nr:hypothetical protein [Paenibacillus baekrokdamisoli]MBB3069083.1 hypothetical protein [Paenibacillus baekrokdamisoli]
MFEMNEGEAQNKVRVKRGELPMVPKAVVKSCLKSLLMIAFLDE